MKRWIESAPACIKAKLMRKREKGAQRHYAFWLLKQYARTAVLRGEDPVPKFAVVLDDRQGVDGGCDGFSAMRFSGFSSGDPFFALAISRNRCAPALMCQLTTSTTHRRHARERPCPMLSNYFGLVTGVEIASSFHDLQGFLPEIHRQTCG